MPQWTFIPLDFEPRPTGSQVFVQADTPFGAELGKVTSAQDQARQQYFEDQLKHIAWHLGSDQVPVFLDFNGDKRRMDKGCVGHSVAAGFLEPPTNGPGGYVTHVTLKSAGSQPSPGGTAELWHEYMREEIAPLFGGHFSEANWRQGFILQGQHVFLLVTLDKEDLQEEHRYDDAFLSPMRFRWQSQNRTTQASRHGQIISKAIGGYAIHLFVRRSKKLGGKASPFRYCGDVDFISWSGEQPITVEWALQTPVPPELASELKIPAA